VSEEGVWIEGGGGGCCGDGFNGGWRQFMVVSFSSEFSASLRVGVVDFFFCFK